MVKVETIVVTDVKNLCERLNDIPEDNDMLLLLSDRLYTEICKITGRPTKATYRNPVGRVEMFTIETFWLKNMAKNCIELSRLRHVTTIGWLAVVRYNHKNFAAKNSKSVTVLDLKED